MSVTLPDGYAPPIPDRLPGGSDSEGHSLPMCEPSSHKADGKHSMLCYGGAWGYHRLADGSWERDTPDPMTVPGAVFRFEGEAYVRIAERGVSLGDESEYDYLERLPEGPYRATIVLERLPWPPR